MLLRTVSFPSMAASSSETNPTCISELAADVARAITIKGCTAIDGDAVKMRIPDVDVGSQHYVALVVGDGGDG